MEQSREKQDYQSPTVTLTQLAKFDKSRTSNNNEEKPVWL